MIATALEGLAGMAFLIVPGITIILLFGAEPHGDGLMLGRIGGAALFCLGIACWRAQMDPGSVARAGIFDAIMLYNAGAGGLLIVYAVTGQATGVLTWIAGLLHLGLAAAFAASRRWTTQ